MKRALNILSIITTAGLLASCGTSEQYIQDDVYSVKTPLIPPGTDLTDVTDYSTYVAKKEQTKEKTIYNSSSNGRPGDFYDPTFRMMYRYDPFNAYFMGYPYNNMMFGSSVSYGFMGFYTYNRHFNPWYFRPYGNSYPYYSGHGQPFMGYYSPYYPPYNYYPSYFENSPFGYGHPGGYGYGNYGFGGYGGYGYGGNNVGFGGYSSGGYYSQTSKPNTPGNFSRMSAGSSAGRYGSGSNGQVEYYPNELKTSNGGTYNGVGRDTDKRDMVNSRTGDQSAGSTEKTTRTETLRPTTGRVIEGNTRGTGIVRPSEATDRTTIAQPTQGAGPVRTAPRTISNERVVRPAGAVSTPRVESPSGPIRTTSPSTPGRTSEPIQTSPGRTVTPSRHENTISTPRSTSPTIRSTPTPSGGGSSPGRGSSGTISGGRR